MRCLGSCIVATAALALSILPGCSGDKQLRPQDEVVQSTEMSQTVSSNADWHDVTVEDVTFSVADDMEFDDSSSWSDEYGSNYWISPNKSSESTYSLNVGVAYDVSEGITGAYAVTNVNGIDVYWQIYSDGTGGDMRFISNNKEYQFLFVCREDVANEVIPYTIASLRF